jgi:iron complex outermembrane receptor protein
VDGEYALDVPSSAETLRFSFIGYEAQEVPIEGRTTINIALSPDAGSLDEVVVIGYGTQEERDVTGAVESVRTEDFNQAPVVSPENLISGKVAGLQISGDGSPGGSNLIRIRGSNSLESGNEPLFVIDGVPIDNGGSRAQRNPLNFLNPNDIASMTVLKDASATAIYGSRGANGVILIETKQAEEGEGIITYRGTASTSEVTDRISMMDAEEYRQVVRENAPRVADEIGLTSTDWQDLVERQAFSQEHSISFARGYEDSDFRLSLGYLDQEGTLQGSSTERISLSFNYNQQFLNDDLTLTANLRGSQTEDEFEPAGVVANAAQFNPTVPVRDVDSEFGGFFEISENVNSIDNPIAQLVMSEANGSALRSLGNIEAEYRFPFVEGLSGRLNVGYDVQSGEQTFFAPNDLKRQAISDNPGQVERANFTRVNTLLDAYLSYDEEFDSIDSRFDITAGYSYQGFNSQFPEFIAQDLERNIFGVNSTAPAQEFETSISSVENRLISGFGRVNYTFSDRYLATFTVRRDGSSRFGPENQ